MLGVCVYVHLFSSLSCSICLPFNLYSFPLFVLLQRIRTYGNQFQSNSFFFLFIWQAELKFHSLGNGICLFDWPNWQLPWSFCASLFLWPFKQISHINTPNYLLCKSFDRITRFFSSSIHSKTFHFWFCFNWNGFLWVIFSTLWNVVMKCFFKLTDERARSWTKTTAPCEWSNGKWIY